MLLKEVNGFCLFFNRIRRLMLYLLLICDYFHSLMKQTSGGGWWVSQSSAMPFLCKHLQKKEP